LELIMSHHDPYDAMSEDEKAHAVAEEQRRYIDQNFHGENLFVGLATDDITPSRRPSSAQQMAKDYNDALGDLAREERNRDLAVAQALRRDRQAFERVEAGQGDERDRIAAHRHATRHGLIPKESTVDKLIRQGERQRRVRT
jgi:hypothetical protein